jgi:hypothetical protein
MMRPSNRGGMTGAVASVEANLLGMGKGNQEFMN